MTRRAAWIVTVAMFWPAVAIAQGTASPAYQLATIDTKALPPPELVAKYDAVLTQLERHCRQTRFSEPSLGDIAVNGVKVLKAYGHTLTVLNLLQAAQLSVTATKARNVDCTMVMASFIRGYLQEQRPGR